ncbi:MAG: hypothetical protein HC862_11120 [Scytonema sp. RU_4_4]|nr:hypothetical protein [Scytonema sp. RU_4_4]NJR73335.1 hypothetical protein [Scytonema sp. CRU_2_7]
MKSYQLNRDFVVDGILGPKTWHKMTDDIPEEVPC